MKRFTGKELRSIYVKIVPSTIIDWDMLDGSWRAKWGQLADDINAAIEAAEKPLEPNDYPQLRQELNAAGLWGVERVFDPNRQGGMQLAPPETKRSAEQRLAYEKATFVVRCSWPGGCDGQPAKDGYAYCETHVAAHFKELDEILTALRKPDPCSACKYGDAGPDGVCNYCRQVR